MSSILTEPDHWRERAEEMISKADQTNDPLTKETMLTIAVGYELLAERAEERLAQALNIQIQRRRADD